MDITDYDDLRCFCFFLSLVLFMQGAGLSNSSVLGIGILDMRSSIVGENGCNAIGFTSVLEGRQQYMEELQMVCKKKLSTMVLLAERNKTVMCENDCLHCFEWRRNASSCGSIIRSTGDPLRMVLLDRKCRTRGLKVV